MKNDLTAFPVAVDDRSETTLINPLDLRNLLHPKKQGPQIFHSVYRYIHEGWDMNLRNNNHMNRSHGMEIIKGQNLIRFVDLGTGDLTAHNLAKNTVIHLYSPSCRNHKSFLLFAIMIASGK
jgi:hypothetical protein